MTRTLSLFDNPFFVNRSQRQCEILNTRTVSWDLTLHDISLMTSVCYTNSVIIQTGLGYKLMLIFL